jgi:hypothetical protein
VIKGTTCLRLEIPGTRMISSDPRDLTLIVAKHGIGKINITPNIRTNYAVIIYTLK